MRGKRLSIVSRTTLAILTLAVIVTGTAAGQEKVLHSFNNDGKDGTKPVAGLVFDSRGRLYGTTAEGGAYGYYGTVFELTPTAGGSWTEKVLHSFNDNGKDGYNPYAGLIFDASGNLYGTTGYGGAYGYGTVFELTHSAGIGWTEKVLHSFNDNGTDGRNPVAGLVFDAAGNLYGTTYRGGAHGYGTAFELTPTGSGSWTETVLHNFNYDGKDGYFPGASLIVDASGNLYGTTEYGGLYSYGTVFELTPTAGGSWMETVLHNFGYIPDGSIPYAGLIVDASGNLYGTTYAGGVYGYGTAFELTPTGGGSWTETVLYNFDNNGGDGASPPARLIFDSAGNLYSAGEFGGAYSYGTVFELTPTVGGSWAEKVLHSFNLNGKDGINPSAGLVLDSAGNLYSTTVGGGAYDYGTVFEIKH
jgi:uncharacterized repeat protein (TIGR03803 family)